MIIKRSMRSKATQNKYLKAMSEGLLEHGCNLCKETPIKEFTHWQIMENRFPYDAIAKVHHMIMPKRHVTYDELNAEEKAEYDVIKSTYIEKEYEFLHETFGDGRSIPSHFHISLMIYK